MNLHLVLESKESQITPNTKISKNKIPMILNNIFIKNFLLQNVVRADIFPVLWQFLIKNAASPLAGEPQITGACFRRLRRRKMFVLI